MPNKNAGSCSANSNNTHTPNPIHTGTGNKYWSDTDYASASGTALRFSRYYNSQNTAVAGSLGTAWLHSYGSFITTGLTVNDVAVVFMTRPNGISYSFADNGNSYLAQDADVNDALVRLTDASGTPTGWQYNVAAGKSVETYDVAGKLISIADRSGFMRTMVYSDSGTPIDIAPKAGLLIRVADFYARELNFTYASNGRLKAMTDPAGATYRYAYDASNNLASVTYPDNKFRTYHYNEAAYTAGANLPHVLTGITDENNVRHASYYYDAQGKAVSSEHAGGVNQYQVGYSSDGKSSTITDPLGTARTTYFTTILGVIKATGQSQPGGSGCGPAASDITYDANGNVALRTDFNGAKTTYAYDLSRNLETKRVEGAGTAQARTVSTEWHPSYRLPLRIAEPLRLTTNSYDARGNLLGKTVQATTDPTGASGFDATPSGTARTWRYTYNEVGQVLTAIGPRTDVIDKTTYAYDDFGNLAAVTNAAGHVTALAGYDANGRVGRITDPNGAVTELAYSPRGWLVSRKVGSETTAYDYDGIGQLTKATQPDGSYVAYTYDDAHRLTGIADSVGNRIAYTLDAMGNRIREEVKDPDGQLARQTTRVYDALNRLQQTTGALQ